MNTSDCLKALVTEVCLYGGRISETGENYIRFSYLNNDYVIEKMGNRFVAWVAQRLFISKHIDVPEEENTVKIIRALSGLVR